MVEREERIGKLEKEISKLRNDVEAYKIKYCRLKEFLNQVDVVIWINDCKTTKLYYVNPMYEKVWGRSCKSLYEDPESYIETIHPADKERIRSILNQHQKGCNYGAKEYRIIRPDGGVRYIRDRAIPIYNSAGEVYRIAGLAEDITDYKRLEIAHKESEHLYQTLLTALPDAVTVSDLDHKITYVSPRVLTLFGYVHESELIGKNLTDWIDPSQYEKASENIAKIFAGEKNEPVEYLFLKADGTKFPVEVTSSLIRDAQGTPKGMISVTRDISERKRAEEEIRNAKQKAEAADKAKGTFIAVLSHELRTPLTAIIGYARMFKNDANLTEDQKAGMHVIEQCGEQLLSLIIDILEVSKSESGRMELQIDEFDFLPFIDDIVRVMNPRAEEKHLTFICNRDPDLPRRLRADEKRLRQVLLNLLGNAVKFTDKGYVVLAVLRRESSVRFLVEDTGIGIQEDMLKTIFLPFTQLEAGKSRGEGAGLGLSISKKIVEMMHSDLHVESAPGKGSKFWFDLRIVA